MSPKTAATLSRAVPRYTSYPTAPHFHAGLPAATFRGWLAELADGEEISLYVHIPYCDRLCWFCACHTKQTRRYEPVDAYLRSLRDEIAMVGAITAGKVRAVHFGGGSPTMLRPDDLIALDRALRKAFAYLPDTEISVEIDPNDMDEARFDALAAIGMTRASLGVQDFDPKVQRAINREQSFEQTAAVVEAVRSCGVRSVNLDLLYGLPHQTRDSVASTVKCALALEPDRIALFGYAHVPWFKKHQMMIDEAWLPGAGDRFAQSRLASDLIERSGYQEVGLDHFARPGDTLAVAARNGRLRRNFQGYTDDRCATLIGLGPSSISRLHQGYAQNTTVTGDYERKIAGGELAVARGMQFTDDDRIRGWVIERLMCDFAFSSQELVRRFGESAQALVAEAECHAASDPDRLFERRGDLFVVADEGRPLVRTIAAKFDRYLGANQARHSVAV
ncbi:oxygen-independent coproporphyrinogen-3 oxidase [Mesorhizobium albiziae]|uniref:Coproporphyrinogen-III oxidase n=1 Tax=Neomesorhizobium albiziae TaxID=335020 RepID=A0A1I3ZNW7_9HYPH|nr:oxygen-independent coproporphyrinogen III oxidase [Mesorhizobium albiziae]GLS32273.1 coproporphyrinogen-III oxidase [Mesorhizobium albiziae]SFK45620.1 oxygen-independent coproporphyrinogen-3 oxidase [Mesorhizobium albiziae]